MNVLGWIFALLLAVVAVTGAVTLIKSIPDINRYRKIRQM